MVNVYEQNLTITSTGKGIPVIVEQLPNSRSVAVAACVGVGSRHEDKTKNGISHFLEHMLFRGTHTRDYREVNETIEDAGGYLNAFTMHELTAFYSLTMDETIDTGLILLADIFKNPKMAEEHVSLEKGIIKQELNSVINDPDMYIRRLLMQTHFGDHPLARAILGSNETIDSFQRDELLDYHAKHYSPPNIVIVAAGNMGVDKIVEWASENFDDLPSNGGKVDRTPPKHRAVIDVYPRQGEHTYVGIGVPGVAAGDDRAPICDLMCTVLNGGSSSRFNHKIREEQGLVYSITTSPIPYRDCGTIDTFFSTTSERAEKVLQIYSEEIKRFKNEGLKPGELDRAKRIIKGAILRTVGQPREDMRSFLFSYLVTGKVRKVDEVIARYEAVTEEQIVAFAQEHMQRKKMCGAVHAAMEQAEPVAAKAAAIDF
ncbi:MAG: Peptidase M16 inactive domain protein [Methanomassiliicoccales archaeon PtaU1.Bin124]|nr:MAG: Peptidase M16 inactive domain protein [Methanomassiliicoccales archaeon PtaU1.Bin124]